MNFDELQANWQQSGGATKSQTELQMMTKLHNHPTLRRIRLKLIAEVVLLIAFAVLYNNAFDGNSKPLWANLVLVASAVLFIANDVMGYMALQRLVMGESIKQSIENLRRTLQYLSVFSIASSLFFGFSVMLFFTSSIHFTMRKYFLLVGMAITLIALSYGSYRNWRSRIRHFQHVAENLGEAV